MVKKRLNALNGKRQRARGISRKDAKRQRSKEKSKGKKNALTAKRKKDRQEVYVLILQKHIGGDSIRHILFKKFLIAMRKILRKVLVRIFCILYLFN